MQICCSLLNICSKSISMRHFFQVGDTEPGRKSGKMAGEVSAALTSEVRLLISVYKLKMKDRSNFLEIFYSLLRLLNTAPH